MPAPFEKPPAVVEIFTEIINAIDYERNDVIKED